jgi:hypothetical protein
MKRMRRIKNVKWYKKGGIVSIRELKEVEILQRPLQGPPKG